MVYCTKLYILRTRTQSDPGGCSKNIITTNVGQTRKKFQNFWSSCTGYGHYLVDTHKKSVVGERAISVDKEGPKVDLVQPLQNKLGGLADLRKSLSSVDDRMLILPTLDQ